MSGSLDSWHHEKESAWLYRQVAAAEPDPRKQRLFGQLAAAAEEQAAKWESSLRRQVAQPLPGQTFRPSTRARIVARLVLWLGPRAMRSVLAAMKLRGLSIYSGPAVAGHDMPTTLADVGQRHRDGLGGNLRATVFGINDGLISNASLVMGIAGAGAEPRLVLITGLAGLLAGALSMSAGEYVSVRSQREMYEYQIALERAEIAEYPEEEAEELALIYEARGIKPMWAVLDECAFSAAYAIASAADTITIPRTGGAGSIGVITLHTDMSRAIDAAGLTVSIITHGSRKAEGTELQPLDPDARARIQADINTLGDLFINTVARNRALPADALREMQAGTFMGDQAVAAGLADFVAAPDIAVEALLDSLSTGAST